MTTSSVTILKTPNWLNELKGQLYLRTYGNSILPNKLVVVLVTEEQNGFIVWCGYNSEPGSEGKLKINQSFFLKREEALETAVWRYKQMKKEWDKK